MLNDSEIQNQITHNYAITLVPSDFGCFYYLFTTYVKAIN